MKKNLNLDDILAEKKDKTVEKITTNEDIKPKDVVQDIMSGSSKNEPENKDIPPKIAVDDDPKIKDVQPEKKKDASPKTLSRRNARILRKKLNNYVAPVNPDTESVTLKRDEKV